MRHREGGGVEMRGVWMAKGEGKGVWGLEKWRKDEIERGGENEEEKVDVKRKKGGEKGEERMEGERENIGIRRE